MDESTENTSEPKNMADIIENMAVETYEMEEAAFNMLDSMVQVKEEEEESSIKSSESETTDKIEHVKVEETPFEMVDINNMVEFENEEANSEIEDDADPISDSGNLVEVTFQVAPMTHRVSEPKVNAVDFKDDIKVTVANIKKQVFYELPPDMQIAMKRLGRPTPMLKIVHHLRDSSSGKHKSTYHLVIYDKNTWVCGCEITNRLFCFPCLLLSKRGNAPYNNWIESGINDLQNLGSKMNEHESSELHLTAVAALQQIDVHLPFGSKSHGGIGKQNVNTAILKPNVRNETSDKISSVAVSTLKSLMFSNLSSEQKLQIKQIGRPTPLLKIFSSATYENREVNRIFKMDMYNKCSWLCGCENTNKFFCFPCLLYSNRDIVWTEQGFDDLNHLSARIKKHECTHSHLNAMIELNLLGKVNICQQLEGSYRKCREEHKKGIKDHNERVVRNRNVLSKLIDCIKLCGAFESALQTKSEQEGYSNSGVVRGIINLAGELDASFKRDIEENPTVFKGVSEEFQNYLLNCILLVCQENIKREIAASNYVSVIVDEATDSTSTFRLAIIFRYVHTDGQPVERFWAFVKPHCQEAGHVVKCISDAVQSVVPDRNKLISQSYGGGCTISGQHSNIQSVIKNQYPFAFYVHCYAHDLSLVLAQVTSRNQQVRIFFSNLSDIVNFWCSTPVCFTTLAEIFSKRQYTPHEINFLPTQTSFKTRPVDAVYRYGKDIIACMEEIEATSKHSSTICKAGHIRRILSDQEFISWIKVFYSVIPHVDQLMVNILQARTETLKIKHLVDHALEGINKDVNRNENSQEFLNKKRPRIEDMSKAEKEVRQVICSEIVKRYSFSTPFSAESLFDSKHFMKYQKILPVQMIDEIVQAYPFLDSARLKAELVAIYHQQDFVKLKGVVSLLVFLTENDLQNTFSETYKLLSIIATIPMTTNEDERRFDTVRRINTFFQSSSLHHNSLTAVAMLSIERNMITTMPNFNEQVIDLFSSQQEWATNFSFKKCDW